MIQHTVLHDTNIPNQVARDHQLLNIATDYSQFVANFFEVINISATHVYHSALELSPLSSIIRKVYYSQKPHPLPKVVTGAPDSWGPNTAVSTKHVYYLSSTWSPCGQFIAVAASEAVEIWDALTLKLLSTFKLAKTAAKFKPGLSYSPDGHSLAGCSDSAIVIWDTQTGGEVKKIECGVMKNGLELVWSLDGKSICTFPKHELGSITMHIYNVASGTTLPPFTLQSRDTPCVWAYNKSFRIATTAAWDSRSNRIKIFETGSTPTEIESLPFQSSSVIRAFSPTTYRISITTSVTRSSGHAPKLVILDTCNSEVLLQETGSYKYPSFSLDGSLFAAFTGDHLNIWGYTSGHYIKCREFQRAPTPLQFSPTLSSLLGCAGPLLYMLHLDNSPVLLEKPLTTTKNQLLDAFAPDSTYIATAHQGESTITITNLHSQKPFPSQFIDTELEISAMVLTGKVLLVKGPETLVAWLLTEEGVVDSIVGNTRADCNDSLWEMSTQALTNQRARQFIQSQRGGEACMEFSVRDEIGAITLNGSEICVYHTGTGEILKSVDIPLNLHPTWYTFWDGCSPYYHDLCKHYKVLGHNWPVSQATLQEGWVKDPEGKHRLWLYGHWRSAGNSVDWLHNATTLRLKTSSELVIVKF